MSDRTLETRALHCLVRYREPGKTPYRLITPAMRADLLGWAPCSAGYASISRSR
jgi:hypothetical protein